MKTPEDIKKALCECDEGYACKRIECPYDDGKCLCNGSRCMMDARKDSLAYIHQLEAQAPKWISVEERLPEKEGKYIVCTAKGSVYCTKFSTRHGPCFHTDMYTHITHWMPLPEPPKEEQ